MYVIYLKDIKQIYILPYNIVVTSLLSTDFQEKGFMLQLET